MTGGGVGSLRDELEGLIGTEGLRELSAARGGRRLYVPMSVRPGHWLAERLGPEAAERLAFQYGGCRISIPALSRSQRNDDIRRWRSLGYGAAEIAERFSLSERQVYNILSE